MGHGIAQIAAQTAIYDVNLRDVKQPFLDKGMRMIHTNLQKLFTKSKITKDVAGLMLTNPNTLGIFDHQVKEIKEILESVDALFYMDGANMNALFGIVRPGDMGFDVMHLNLHKSFSTPHGGGGPGTGPVAVNKKLEKFLPRPTIQFDGESYYFDDMDDQSIGRDTIVTWFKANNPAKCGRADD